MSVADEFLIKGFILGISTFSFVYFIYWTIKC